MTGPAVRKGSAGNRMGRIRGMKRVLRKRIRRSVSGVQVVADVNAVLVTGPEGSASADQHVRVVQRNGRTVVDRRTYRLCTSSRR